MKQILTVFRQLRSQGGMGRGQVAVLIPGLLLVALGIAAILAPQIIAVLVAAFLIYVGVLALFVGWKIIQMRHRVQQMMQDLSQHVRVVSFNRGPFEDGGTGDPLIDEGSVVELVQDDFTQEEAPPEIRKIIVH
jgi:hypothetical protein